MPGIRFNIANVQALARKFEELTARAGATPRPAAPATREAAGLREVTDFGSNPGNLRMLVHVPEPLLANAPLVVALHGCGQTAAEYAVGTGWSALADQLGCVVVFPEQ